jgi:hypothetical protein
MVVLGPNCVTWASDGLFGALVALFIAMVFGLSGILSIRRSKRDTRPHWQQLLRFRARPDARDG